MMITHDLGVIAEISQRVIVMYAGKVVEEGKTEAIFDDPKHPYTQDCCARSQDRRRTQQGRRRLQEITGNVPIPINCRRGAAFIRVVRP
jgi:oligopeptide/dipeptide ABC transporter ATP-binding protein